MCRKIGIENKIIQIKGTSERAHQHFMYLFCIHACTEG